MREVSLEVTRQVFSDSLHLSVLAERFNCLEERWITVVSARSGTIVVAADLCFTEDAASTRATAGHSPRDEAVAGAGIIQNSEAAGGHLFDTLGVPVRRISGRGYSWTCIVPNAS